MSFASTWPIRRWGGGTHPAAVDNFGIEPLNAGPHVTEFARSVRVRRWTAALPLLASVAASAAMLWIAAAPPPTREAQHAYDVQRRADPIYQDPAADFSSSYELAPNWAWPSLETTEQPTSMVSR